MPLYYVLYCAIGMNYRRFMPGKKFLGDQKLKLGRNRSSQPRFVTSTDFPARVQIPIISKSRLYESLVLERFKRSEYGKLGIIKLAPPVCGNQIRRKPVLIT